MASECAREAFHEVVRRLQFPRSSAVGEVPADSSSLEGCFRRAVVGLSGGPDSVALTYLARLVFRRVVAVTVDHRSASLSLSLWLEPPVSLCGYRLREESAPGLWLELSGRIT